MSNVINPCTARLVTAPGRSAIAVIVIEGMAADTVVGNFYQSLAGQAPCEMAVGRVTVGRWGDDKANEELVLCRTSEHQFEISCHGGDFASRRIMTDLADQGVRVLHEAPALADPYRELAWRLLQKSRTTKTAAILLDQYRGRLSDAIAAIKVDLANNRLESARQRTAQLLQFELLGSHLIQPWRVAVCGPTNVGKSSLLNAIVGFERAIVYDQPGTTRDAVTVETVLDGWLVEFVDTAGLRETTDGVEKMGIEKSLEEAAGADLVLQVFDARQPVSKVQREGVLLVANKCDLLESGEVPDGAIRTSALHGAGIDELIHAIVQRLVPVEPPTGAAIPLGEDCVRYLHRLLESPSQPET